MELTKSLQVFIPLMSIGTTLTSSSSTVLAMMIAGSVNEPICDYAVVVIIRLCFACLQDILV
jgi:hypothetical protein